MPLVKWPPRPYLVTADSIRAALTEITVARSRQERVPDHESVAMMRVHARELGDHTCSTESCWPCILAYAFRPGLTEQRAE